MKSLDREAVQKVISDSKLLRNARGQLRAILDLVDADLQKVIACDYSEHVIWICEEVSNGDQRFRRMIDLVRQFVHNKATLEEIAEARNSFFKAHYQFQEIPNWDARVALQASNSIMLALNVCCQRQLEELGAIAYRSYQPNAMAVADEASQAVGKYAAGQDLHSNNPELRNTARRRGNEASNIETQWQLTKLFEYLNIDMYQKS